MKPLPSFRLFASIVSAVAFIPTVAAQTWQVYFGTGGGAAKGIYRATFDVQEGKLSAAELAAEIRAPGFLAVHPDGQKLYAVGTVNGIEGAAGYRIGSDGSLELINASPTGDGGGAHLAVHPSGRFLLTAQYGGGSVALFPLDTNGRLGAAQLSRHEGGTRVVAGRQDAPHPHWCGFSPDGRFALVPDLGLDGIVIYRVNPDAPAIERHGFAASERGGGARHLRFSPDGRFIYLLNELTLSVTTFAWDAANGTARQLGTVPALSEAAKAKESFNSAAEILVHPSGRFVYSSNRGHDTVSVYRADPGTGALEVIQVQPVRGAFPRNIALAPGGGWLLAAGADSNTVAVHQVNPETGELTYLTRRIINVPSPICIVFVQPGVAPRQGKE
jgi:6-phosphogluconolactonase